MHSSMLCASLATLSIIASTSIAAPTNNDQRRATTPALPTLFLGTYSTSQNPGLMITMEIDGDNLRTLATQPRVGSGASWVTFGKQDASSSHLVYTVNDHAWSASGQHALHSWKVKPSSTGSDKGKLTPLNIAGSGQEGTVHASVSKHPDAKCLYSANYGGRSTTVVQLRKDGSIRGDTRQLTYYSGNGPNQRQDQSRPYQMIDSPDGQFVYVPDLGTDQIHVFSLSKPSSCTLKSLQSVPVSSGDGPRHMTFFTTPSGAVHAYLVTELSGTIRAYKQDTKSGNLKLMQTLTTRPDLTGQPDSVVSNVAPSEVIVSPDGKFVYVTVRHLPHDGAGNTTWTDDLIAHYTRDTSTGRLSAPFAFTSSGGRNPRHFSMHASGAYVAVANQGEDADPNTDAGLAILNRDASTGILSVKSFTSNPGAAVAMFAPW